jgi:hypothetical protein
MYGCEKAKIIAVKASNLVSKMSHFFSCELLRVCSSILFKKWTFVNGTFVKRCN